MLRLVVLPQSLDSLHVVACACGRRTSATVAGLSACGGMPLRCASCHAFAGLSACHLEACRLVELADCCRLVTVCCRKKKAVW